MPTDPKNPDAPSARTIEQVRREMAALEEQIRASKETIANSEKLLQRLNKLMDDLS